MNRAKKIINLVKDTSEGHRPEIFRYGKCPTGYKWDSHYKRCFPNDGIKKESHHEDVNKREMVHILYPDDSFVAPEKIMTRASDAYANGEIDHEAEDLHDAVMMLDDAGIITISKNWLVVREDLWPASKPGFGDGAKTQLVPEKKRNSNWICPKCGFKDKANREEVLDAMCTCPKCGACMKEEK